MKLHLAKPSSIALAIIVLAASLGQAQFFTDFSTVPAGAYVPPGPVSDPNEARIDEGILKLTDAVNAQGGIFYVDDFVSGIPVTHFRATFKAMLFGSVCCGTTPADGFSFNLVPSAVPNPAYNQPAEDGLGEGLTVSFDTWDNGAAEAPAIDVKWLGATIGHVSLQPSQSPLGVTDPMVASKDVVIELNESGQVSVSYGDQNVFSNLQTPYTPISGGTWVLGARTGGANDNHWIDDLRIDVFTAGPVFIVKSPTNVTVRTGFTATFSGAADGTPPIYYQWLRDGTPVSGATSNTYTTGALTTEDNGTVFTLVASNALGIASASATLTVNADVTPPTLVAAHGAADLSKVLLSFSEPIAQFSGEEVFNYEVQGFTVISAQVDATRTNIILTLDHAMAPGQITPVTIQDLSDLAGNAIAPNPSTVPLHAFTISPGFATREFYLNISGVNVSELTNNAKYPNSPDTIEFARTLETPHDFQSNPDVYNTYGSRVRGYLLPPVSGNYNFFMASDDGGQFWLSTDADPANLQLIASEPQWNPIRAWTTLDRRTAGAPENQSTTLFPAGIPLVAGQPYYFELLLKEEGGGDNAAVTWQLPGTPIPANGSPAIIGAYLATLVDPVGASIMITQQPTDQVFVNATVVQPLLTETFDSNGGGYTVETPAAFAGAWSYDAARGTWHEDGQDADNGQPNTSKLNSPAYTVTESGSVTLSFTHRFSFEHDGTAWDGGAVYVSVNGGPFTPVPAISFTQNGYGGNTVAGGSSSALSGQPAFTSQSPGYATGFITSIADLGHINAGDTVRIQFVAASDTNTRGQVPNWEIDSLHLDQGGLPTSVTFSVGVTGAIAGSTNPPIFYQWYRDSGAGFVPIVGAHGSTLTLTPTPADNGSRFYVAAYVPGASTNSEIATLSVVQPNTPPQFNCGPDQIAAGGGARVVPNWATGIAPHSYTLAPLTFASDFNTASSNALFFGSANVSNAFLELTAAENAVFGVFYTPTFPARVDSLDVTFTLAVGGGTCCGDPTTGGPTTTADGASFSFANDLPFPATYGNPGEEGAGSGLVVQFDTWDNGGGEAPAITVAYNHAILFSAPIQVAQAPAPAVPVFVPTRIKLDSDGTLDVQYGGSNVVTDLATGFLPVLNGQAAFGARTGGANEAHWIDDLSIVARAVDNSAQEAGQMVQFVVSNDNPTLFAAQPAVSPSGDLSYTIANDRTGTALVTVVAVDDGGTAAGGNDTSASCTFTITVPGGGDSPLDLKRGVLQTLLGVRSSITRTQDLAALDDAIRHLTNATNALYWVDSTHLHRKKGNHAFMEENAVVSALCSLLQDTNSTVSAATIRAAMDQIILADRTLAATAISEAEAAGAPAKKMATARAQFAKGETPPGNGECADGIEHYKNAWHMATRALVSQTVHVAEGRASLQLLANRHETCTIQASSDLKTWVTIGTVTADSEGVAEFIDNNGAPGASVRFYRILSQ